MQESRKSTAGHTRKGEATDEKTANMPFLISCFWETGMFHAYCVRAPCLLRLCSEPIAFGSYTYCISVRHERHGTDARIARAALAGPDKREKSRACRTISLYPCGKLYQKPRRASVPLAASCGKRITFFLATTLGSFWVSCRTCE